MPDRQKQKIPFLRAIAAIALSAVGSALVSLILRVSPSYRDLGIALLVLSVPTYFMLSLFIPFVSRRVRRAGRNSFLLRDRKRRKYQEKVLREVIEAIAVSRTIDFMLVSGYTMWFSEDEGSIGESLQSLSRKDLEQKRIRVLLMDRSVNEWRDRAEKFIRREGYLTQLDGIEEYQIRCEEAETNFIDLIDSAAAQSEVAHYTHPPLFRLLIFDTKIFMGFYHPNQSGHFGMLRIPNEDSFRSGYDALTEYFERELQDQELLRAKPAEKE